MCSGDRPRVLVQEDSRVRFSFDADVTSTSERTTATVSACDNKHGIRSLVDAILEQQLRYQNSVQGREVEADGHLDDKQLSSSPQLVCNGQRHCTTYCQINRSVETVNDHQNDRSSVIDHHHQLCHSNVQLNCTCDSGLHVQSETVSSLCNGGLNNSLEDRKLNEIGQEDGFSDEMEGEMEKPGTDHKVSHLCVRTALEDHEEEEASELFNEHNHEDYDEDDEISDKDQILKSELSFINLIENTPEVLV